MTDSPEPSGQALPQQPSIVLDAVAGHLRRSVKHLEHEALMLASALRDTDAALQTALAKNAALEAELAALQGDAGGA